MSLSFPLPSSQSILVKSNIDWPSYITVFDVLRSWRRKEKQTSMTVDESWRHVHRSLDRGRINTWRWKLEICPREGLTACWRMAGCWMCFWCSWQRYNGCSRPPHAREGQSQSKDNGHNPRRLLPLLRGAWAPSWKQSRKKSMVRKQYTLYLSNTRKARKTTSVQKLDSNT